MDLARALAGDMFAIRGHLLSILLALLASVIRDRAACRHRKRGRRAAGGKMLGYPQHCPVGLRQLLLCFSVVSAACGTRASIRRVMKRSAARKAIMAAGSKSDGMFSENSHVFALILL